MLLSIILSAVALARPIPSGSFYVEADSTTMSATITGLVWAATAPTPPVTVEVSWVTPTGNTGSIGRIFNTAPVNYWNGTRVVGLNRKGVWMFRISIRASSGWEERGWRVRVE